MLVTTQKLSRLKSSKNKTNYRKGAFAPFFLPFIFLIISLTSHAQEEEFFQGQFNAFGLLSQVAGDGYSGYKKIGWNVELGVALKGNSDSTSYYFGVGSRRIGSRELNNSGAGLETTFNYSLDYVFIPFRYQSYLYGLQYEIGPSLMRFVNGKKEFFNGIQSTNDEYRNWQLTLDVLIGYQVNNKLTFKGFIHQSLTPIEKVESTNGFYWERGGLALSVGIGLGYNL